ncbi:flavin monoamine oxidase family protein [Ascidiimonas sp. W6]|uniref:flavin monoamine oxidase family protein n=1 Tax=Ascidiimonas meishanensis TaxID=3128903 RepID=UPI0030EF1C63
MILIIGAGLSGLLIGYRLKKEGIPFKILEARNRVGGRINTLYGTTNTPVEMGATWFTNQHKHLIALLEELEIDWFEQYMDSTVFYQASAAAPTQIVQIPSQLPSYRISGGTSQLINTLLERLDKDDVLLNQSVKEIKIYENSVLVNAKEPFKGKSVVLAIPPKLWAKKISFEPYLPTELLNVAKQTHTWMEDSIKIALTYKVPFWQKENLPATLFSTAGPITELYDHCNHKRSRYALCGFINSSFKNLPYAERRTSVIDQLKNTFGPSAEEFMDYEECIWSKEENTFEASDAFLFPHQNNGNPIFNESIFEDRLLISSAESAPEFPGYMEGAVYSANSTALKLIQKS